MNMVDSISDTVNCSSVFINILTMDYSNSTCPVTVYLASADTNEKVPKFEQILMTPKLTDGFRDIIENIIKKCLKEVGGNNTGTTPLTGEKVRRD